MSSNINPGMTLYAHPETKMVSYFNFPPSREWVEIEECFDPNFSFDFEDMKWKEKKKDVAIDQEPLDLARISYKQADDLMKAKTVEELRAVFLDVLGL